MAESKEHSNDDMNIIMQADKQAEIFQHFISLAEKIRPQLLADGANFNLWAKNMIIAWTTYLMGDPDYFQQTTTDDNIKRNLVAWLFIEHSVHSSIYESVTSCIFTSDSRKSFQALKDRFNCPSWSSVAYHSRIISFNSSDQLDNINSYAMTITEAIQNLENQLGQINSEMLTTLAIYFAVPSMHQLITPAINTLMATNPDIKVCPNDILHMIGQISAASPSFNNSTEISRVNAASKFGKRDQNHNFNQQLTNRNIHRKNKVHASSRQPASRAFNPNLPCHYCGKTGHWSPKCPIKAKAIEMREKAQQWPVNIAGMGVVL
ncbi:hypothetical protein O181_105055 [Austropuccinia psidii MF-1]|uniref:CCHC-type domain-containing protein n=1 Tax=Austropuccinia psidii MF-1 TaxID=1389203 RepID=A0A9Q3PLA9_9BASI|nr:hypothetical protein [Austropuccinia psidii MF-1]